MTSDLNMKSIVSTQMKGIPMDNAVGHQRHGKPLQRLQCKRSHLKNHILNVITEIVVSYELMVMKLFYFLHFTGKINVEIEN